MTNYPEEPLWLWLAFNAIAVILILLDLLVFHKKNVVITIKKALIACSGWVGLALLFNLFIWVYRGPEDALNFLTAYLIEESLSIDNLFVFVMIFTYFQTPKKYQYKVLFWGILGAIIMRALFIFFGIALVHSFHWILYVFGVFLIVAAVKMAMPKKKPLHLDDNFILRNLQRFIPLSKEYADDHFFSKINGKWHATPLFAALLTVEMTDLVFAIDSIPAVMGITLDPFIVYTSNIFAVLGLRALYFALAGLLPLFRYLKYALAAILVFIGIKMMISSFFHVPIRFALGFIALSLLTAIIASLIVGKEENQN